jgi:protein-tyrosine kinase
MIIDDTVRQADEEETRVIGDILREMRALNAEAMEQIVGHQRAHGMRFGEAAVALGLATPDDVMYALSLQYNYPYASQDKRNQNPELVMLNQPFSPQAEAIRAMRSQILQLLRTPGDTPNSPQRRALAVISPNRGDGKTYFVANLAIALAQLGKRVAAVDADLRNPRLHEVFGLNNSAGLSGLLSGRQGSSSIVKPVASVPNLFVLPVGSVPPNPMELVEGTGFGLLLHELLAKFDHVVVDTPASAHGADNSVIATRCGAALVVVREDQARAADVKELVNSLALGTTRVIGAVMNEY